MAVLYVHMSLAPPRRRASLRHGGASLRRASDADNYITSSAAAAAAHPDASGSPNRGRAFLPGTLSYAAMAGQRHRTSGVGEARNHWHPAGLNPLLRCAELTPECLPESELSRRWGSRILDEAGYTRKKCCSQHLHFRLMLKSLEKFFRLQAIDQVYPADGLLLGIQRGAAPIPWDKDIDIHILTVPIDQ